MFIELSNRFHKDEIKIYLPNISVEYLITDLTSGSLKLKEKGTNDTIELQKVYLRLGVGVNPKTLDHSGLLFLKKV